MVEAFTKSFLLLQLERDRKLTDETPTPYLAAVSNLQQQIYGPDAWDQAYYTIKAYLEALP